MRVRCVAGPAPPFIGGKYVFSQAEVYGVDNIKPHWVNVDVVSKDPSWTLVADNRNAASHALDCFIPGVGVYSRCQKLKYSTIRYTIAESRSPRRNRASVDYRQSAKYCIIRLATLSKNSGILSRRRTEQRAVEIDQCMLQKFASF
jgi:hypothetical protein